MPARSLARVRFSFEVENPYDVRPRLSCLPVDDRNPYWGRNHEAFGEDPFLTGRMGVAYVKGLQGKDKRYLKLAATLKHYAVNSVETERFQLDAKVSRRMLYDYWLPHFRDAVVDGGACSLMASYNAINGTPNNINHWL